MIKAVIFDFYGVLNKEMLPNQELIKYIKTKLKSKYKLGIISNAIDEFMYQIIAKKDLANIFDDIVISYQVGVAKPEPAIYQTSLNNLGVKPEESVFIDDIERFCEAARALGIQTIWYQDFGQMKNELEKLLAVTNN